MVTMRIQVTKISLLACIMLPFFLSNLRGQSEILLSQNYGGAQDDTFQDIFLTSDDKAVVIGYSQSDQGFIQDNKGLYDMLVCEMSNAGNLNWSRNIGGSQNDLGNSVMVNEDNTFVGGLTYSTDIDIPSSKGGGDILFGNLNTEQEFDAIKILGGNKLDNIVGLKMMLDGSIIVVANTNSTDVSQTGVGGATDIYVCRMLASGVLLWETKFGSSNVDKAADVIINGQDEIIIVGNTYSDDFLEFKKGINDGFVVCINNTGDQLWGRRFGNGNYTSFNACDVDAQNNILIAGTQGQIDKNSSGIRGIYNEDIVVYKLDAQGEVIWQQQHGGMEDDFSTDLVSTLDGGVLVVGNTFSYDNLNNVNFGGQDAFALKLDTDGTKEWSKTYGGSEDDAINSVSQDNLGQYWLVGQSASDDIHLVENLGGKDAWILKLKGKTPQLTVDLGAPITVCEGETVTIDASLNNCDCSYTWSDGVEGAIRDFTAFTSETLSLSVSDEIGNIASDNIRITVNPKPSFELVATNVSCADGMDGKIDAVVLDESTSLTFAWSENNNSNEDELEGLAEGMYSLTVTNENNCSSNESIIISQPDALEANATIIDVVCENPQGEILLEVNGGTGPYEYLWSNDESTSNLLGVSAGTYRVSVTDTNGCSLVESYIIESHDIDVELDFDITENTCSGFSEASISILNSDEISAFEWSTGESSSSISNLETGEYTLNYITNEGCSGEQKFIITEPEPLSVESDVTNNICNDAREGSISINITGGTGPYILAWVNGENTTSIDGLPAGNYSVTINDDNGCALVIEEVVTAPEPIILEETDIEHVLCTGENQGSITIEVAGGIGALEYTWSTGGTTPSITDLSAGAYTVTVVDEADCINIFDFTIEGAEELPEIDIEQTEPLCFGGNDGHIILSEHDNIAYFWPDGFIGNERNDLAAGEYEIIVGNDFGCTKTMTIILDQPTELDMSFNLEHISCFGISDGIISVNTFGGTTPYSLNIEDSASQIFGLSGDQILTDLSAGLYFINLEDANGCVLGLPLVLQEPDPLSIESTIIDVSCFGEMDGQIATEVTGGTGEYTYFWGGNMTTSTLSDLGAGIFQVEVTDENNCSETEIFQVNEPSSIEVIPALTAPGSSNNDGRISLLLSGGEAPYTVSWSNGEEGTLIENLSGGTYEYTIIDASNCSLTGSITLESPTSTFGKNPISEVSIFPNPTNRDLFVQTEIDYQDLQMNMHNALGQVVHQRFFETFTRGTHRISVSQLPSGIYYLTLSTTTSKGVYKIVVE